MMMSLRYTCIREQVERKIQSKTKSGLYLRDMKNTIEQIIAEKISNNHWNEAVSYIKNEYDKKNYSAALCILAATVYEHFNERDAQLSSIMYGLKLEPENYELYVSLGDYYMLSNPDLAYLCYENALMLCPEESQDYEIVFSIFNNCKIDAKLGVKNVTFIIYSSKLENTQRCINSIQATCAKNSYEIIVIENILEPNYDSLLNEFADLKVINSCEFNDIEEAYNLAVKSSSPANDIIITNDYVSMLFNSLFMLRFGLYADANAGISGAIPFARATFNIKDVFSGELKELAIDQNIPKENFIQYHFIVSEQCFIIRRECMDTIGLMDTSFSSQDYFSYSFLMNCINLNFNCLKAGYKVCNNHACYVVSSGESLNINENDVDNKKELYQKLKQKHGFAFDYYASSRDDLIEFINNDFSSQINVLEVGCGLGTTLNTIKYKFSNANVYGIELVRDVAKYASVFTDVRCGDIETMELDYPRDYFDYIIFGDVLEHLRNPIAVLERLKPYIKKDGCILTSIPNVMNISVIFELLSGKWEYRDSGILDRTHLRFFTLETIKTMFSKAGYDICEVYANRNVKVENIPEWFKNMLKKYNFAPIEQFSVFQYLVKARVLK